MAIDLVCGMEVKEKDAKWKLELGGTTYYFCGQMCLEEFKENPQKYIRLQGP